MEREQIAVAVFATHDAAEEAVRTLQRGGFDMRRLSIIGRNYHLDEHVAGFVTTGDRVRFFGTWGAAWGGLAGLLFGASMLAVPLLGHLVVLGPLAATIVSAAEGAVLAGGLGALAGALSSLGIPRESVLRYERALAADQYLLVAHGTADDVQRARDILARGGHSMDVHEARVPVGAAELSAAATPGTAG